MRLSRRRFLLMALASLTTACSDTDHSASAGNAGAGAAWLAQIIGDPEAAARLGRVWLAMHPEYDRGDTLVTDIQKALTKYDASTAFSKNPQRTAAALQQLVREEYIHDEVQTVDGWILSITEARLYGLAALHQLPGWQ
jgi:hypothetical protein